MSDDRPRAPTYGPPLTIPSAYFLGLVAYNAWCEAHRDDPAVDWMELSEERDMWQRIATKVAERIPTATEQRHAFGNYCRRLMATRTLIPSVWSATDQSAPIVTLEM